MFRFSALLIVIIILLCDSTWTQEFSEKQNQLLCEHLKEIGYSDSVITESFLETGITDWYRGENSLDTLGCTDFPIYIPSGGIRFDEQELTEFLSLKRAGEDYINFIRDHDADVALYKAFYNSEGKISKLQQLSLEFNDTFGKPLSVLYYLKNRLRLICNIYCLEAKKALVIREFFWSEDDRKVVQIITNITGD